ncbi:prephenate dehydrogenase [Streptococcus sp. zg-86]|uniref:Prephenate dehydrogenase n=1 Tax=Streptococcus zhangguiae TaxID=2664091 RepID=A0A6I4RK64_9STRE|nr:MULTISPECIES: prephenate dehydrogenase [unclassified Streptococcus]MTB65199.1 prephenate dehydrogenase [Streptococcus sp. zg-86]MTB91519.1 prephenate dehydrogenase [Streptococcus sp. zg-36]MWV57187.1 prephenate dehydrogenase [Streptococcus sp. zg-70]QTH48410.1 prephenate dehydrogenase [Streptococcus sp. zg-86]
MTRTIYIVGLGLIGSSLALGIRRSHPDARIVGYNRGEQSRTIALEQGIVDEASDDFGQFVEEADVIFLCVPIQQTIQFIKELAQLPLKETVLVTDAGSTKEAIVAAAETYLSDRQVNFIGGHPMAGSHKSGAMAADVNLFENAYYILTPSALTQADAIPRLKDILSGLHARFVEIDAAEHDRVTSQISHFPHVLASSLMHQAGEYQEEHPFTQQFAAGGFRDMTRIAESEPGMWTSILLTNKESIIERLAEFGERLKTVQEMIATGDKEAIWQFFDQGRRIRKEMEIHKRAGVDSFYDLFINIPDQEDAILTVLEKLRGISVVNIRINEDNRADIHGILQITFKNKEDLERAEQIIHEQTSYQVFVD